MKNKQSDPPTLPDTITNWRHEQFSYNGQEIRLTIPADPDELLEQLQSGEEEPSFDPYWGHLWPAAKEMAALISKMNWQPNTQILELGCGSGLIGIAALTSGGHVTFSDHQLDALKLAGYNAHQNGFQNYNLLQYDWFDPPNEVEPFPIVIASDVLYEARFHEPLLNVFEKVTATNGEIWIADPGRSLLTQFLRTAQAHHFQFEIYDINRKQKLFPAVGHFQLLRLQTEKKTPSRNDGSLSH